MKIQRAACSDRKRGMNKYKQSYVEYLMKLNLVSLCFFFT
jgi:hypothetical protein